MPSIEICPEDIPAPRGVIDDDRDARIREVELARQRGFGHAGHPDQRRAVALEAVDFRRGLEPRPRYGSVDAAVRAVRFLPIAPPRSTSGAAPANTDA